MKENAKRVWMGIYHGVLILCGLGLVLAVLGLFFKQDPLYYVGLLMAAPLFLIVLPLCILLIVLSIVFPPMAGIGELMGWWRQPTSKDDKNDNQPAQPTRSP
jgi:hypothetical protein